MYHNAPEETRYIYTDFDKDARRLSGANRYAVTLAAGQLRSMAFGRLPSTIKNISLNQTY
jgi:hypothetical protein